MSFIFKQTYLVKLCPIFELSHNISKKSFEGIHWGAKRYWISPVLLWNSTTVTALLASIDVRVTSLGNRTVQCFAVWCDIPSKLSRTVALADPVGENRIPLHFGYLPKGAVGSSCIHCYFLGNYCLWDIFFFFPHSFFLVLWIWTMYLLPKAWTLDFYLESQESLAILDGRV